MLSSGYGSVMADFEHVEEIAGAISAELAAASQYAALAARAPDETARALLEGFAHEETEHARSLAQAYATLMQARWRGEARSPEVAEYDAALQQRLLDETDDYARYANLSQQAVSPWLRKLFSRLSIEEAVHAMRLPLLLRN